MREAKDRIGSMEMIQCHSCGLDTRHTICAAHDVYWINEAACTSGGVGHDLLFCNGCQEPTYGQMGWTDERDTPDNLILLYPDRDSANAARAIRDFPNIPSGPLKAVYQQTIYAFQMKLATLAGAGVRLLIEGVCRDQGVSGGDVPQSSGPAKRMENLQGKIYGLVECGAVSKKQAGMLHEIRALGNDAAHDLDIPAMEVVGSAIDIIEHIFEQVYEQPAKAKSLSGRKRPGTP